LHWHIPKVVPEAHDKVFELAPPPPPAQGSLPPGFALLRAGMRACHIPPERLPWAVHAGDPRYSEVLDSAIDVWNQGALQLGRGALFVRVDDPQAADLELRWSDPRLPRDKAGATWWGLSEGGRRVLGLSLDGSFRVPQGNRVQILAHELGHVLGLGESQQPGDMMFFQMDRRRLTPSQVRLSDRDLQALLWLYTQPTFAPIRGRRER
jgi:hypothetical protein